MYLRDGRRGDAWATLREHQSDTPGWEWSRLWTLSNEGSSQPVDPSTFIEGLDSRVDLGRDWRFDRIVLNTAHRRMLQGVYRGLRMWDMDTWEIMWETEIPDYGDLGVHRIALSPCGQFAAAAFGYSHDAAQAPFVVLLETATGSELRRFPQTGPPICFTPDSKHLLSGGYTQLVIREVPSGKVAYGINRETHRIRARDGAMRQQPVRIDAAAYSPSGAALAIVPRNSLRIRDMANSNVTMPFERYADMPCWNPRGTHIATCSLSGVTLWDVAKMWTTPKRTWYPVPGKPVP